MEYILKNIIVPNEINSKLNTINFLIYKSNVDINEYLATLFTSDEFCQNVFHKSLDIYDWKNIYYSFQSEKCRKYFKNNGILFQHFCNSIIGQKYNLKNLVNFGQLNFEDPEKGSDVIFLDKNFKLQFYEVKSRLTNKNIGDEIDLVKLIKNAINSTFCKKSKNVLKLINAQKVIEKDGKQSSCYELLNEMLNKNSDMISFVNDPSVDFNICIIGEELSIDEEKFKKEIISTMDSAKYCNKDCKYNDIICKKGIMDRIVILNIVNIQFLGKLSLDKLYEHITSKILLKGVIE